MTGELGVQPRALVDTNVLVYGYDESEPLKQPRALDVLDELTRRAEGAISTQVLGEYYLTVTRKIPDPLSQARAREVAERMTAAWTVLGMDASTSLEAMRAAERYQLQYWDAQLWATARLNRVPVILSEDFEDGREIEGVRFVDPFVDGFDLETALER